MIATGGIRTSCERTQAWLELLQFPYLPSIFASLYCSLGLCPTSSRCDLIDVHPPAPLYSTYCNVYRLVLLNCIVPAVLYASLPRSDGARPHVQRSTITPHPGKIQSESHFISPQHSHNKDQTVHPFSRPRLTIRRDLPRRRVDSISRRYIRTIPHGTERYIRVRRGDFDTPRSSSSFSSCSFSPELVSCRESQRNQPLDSFWKVSLFCFVCFSFGYRVLVL